MDSGNSRGNVGMRSCATNSYKIGYTSPGMVDGFGFAVAESADVCGVIISFTNGPIG